MRLVLVLPITDGFWKVQEPVQRHTAKRWNLGLEPRPVWLRNPLFPWVLVPDLSLCFFCLPQESHGEAGTSVFSTIKCREADRTWSLGSLLCLEINADNGKAVLSWDDINFREDWACWINTDKSLGLKKKIMYSLWKKIMPHTGLLKALGGRGVANWRDSWCDCWLIMLQFICMNVVMGGQPGIFWVPGAKVACRLSWLLSSQSLREHLYHLL